MNVSGARLVCPIGRGGSRYVSHHERRIRSGSFRGHFVLWWHPATATDAGKDPANEDQATAVERVAIERAGVVCTGEGDVPLAVRRRRGGTLAAVSVRAESVTMEMAV